MADTKKHAKHGRKINRMSVDQLKEALGKCDDAGDKSSDYRSRIVEAISSKR